VFVFDYGVIVFWGFSLEEEVRYIEGLAQFSVVALSEENVEIENLHFQYDLLGPFQPRIFNDMITLNSGNQLIKLTISHAVGKELIYQLLISSAEY
jgi:uncharacterized Rmd1/YagE family protein